MTMLNIFIGYDERETDVYRLCEQSIIRNCSRPEDLRIVPLKHKELREQGFFDRPWRMTGQTGQYIDERDGKPFSTQFSHSRFLVPVLARKHNMSGHALFVDCDFIFKGDVAEIFDQAEAQKDKAICVVKHDFVPTNDIKMDHCVQLRYKYKLWSALMVFNLDNPHTQDLSDLKVNHKDGSYLHQFGWLPDPSYIGEIDEKWNWIPDHSEERVPEKDIGAIHYTEGGPWFEGKENCDYSEIYWEEWGLWLENELEEFKRKST